MKVHKVLEHKVAHIPVLYFILVTVLLCMAFLTASFGIKLWAGLMGICIVAGVIFATFTDYKYGLLILLFYSYFIFLIGKTLKLNIPPGVPFDLLLFIIFGASLVRLYARHELHQFKKPFQHPIGIGLLIWLVYDLFQLFNPLGQGVSVGISPFRITLAFVIGYVVFYKAFGDYKFIKTFIVFWLVLSLFGALYGLRQEFVGLTNSEWQWLTSDPRRYSLLYQWGRIRKWSIFSDVSTFGIIMAFSSLSCFVLMLGPFKRVYKGAALVAGLLMMLAMTYSGTRTATAMIPIGLGIYFLMNMNNRITIGVAIASVVVFLAIMYGPFYNPTIIRLRSTFNADDPSLSFREYKRKKLQKYVLSHPVGGGLGSANTTAGRLSTTYDPDNGYLRIALDKGIPGLFLQFGLNFIILLTALNGYFRTKNKRIKYIYASFIASFFAISVAQFFQDSLDQKPANFIITAYLAMIVRLKEFN